MSDILYSLPSMLSQLETDSRPFSYRTHSNDHMYFVKEFLCGHTLSIALFLEVDWLLSGNICQMALHFKYADNKMLDIRLPRV